MLGLLVCILWAAVYAIIALVVIELVVWVFGVIGFGLQPRVAQLLRAIAAIVFLIYVIGCLAGGGWSPHVIVR